VTRRSPKRTYKGVDERKYGAEIAAVVGAGAAALTNTYDTYLKDRDWIEEEEGTPKEGFDIRVHLKWKKAEKVQLRENVLTENIKRLSCHLCACLKTGTTVSEIERVSDTKIFGDIPVLKDYTVNHYMYDLKFVKSENRIPDDILLPDLVVPMFTDGLSNKFKYVGKVLERRQHVDA